VGEVTYNTEALKVIADLTVQLTRLRQEQCKHLCIENYAPGLFASLLDAVGYLNPPRFSVES
jgi:hypothetical protein